MPQSTLMGWLSKSKGLQAPSSANVPPREKSDDNGLIQSRPFGENEPVQAEDGGDGLNSTTSAPQVSEDSLPSNVEIRSCTKDDIKSLKQLTSLLLPIQYPEKFYREIIEDKLTNDITLVTIWHENSDTSRKDRGILIGAIRCRLLAYPPSPAPTSAHKKQGPMLYLSTLVLLSPYRRYGIATHMLNMLTKRAVQEHGITSVGAHVWQANAEGLEWYRKRGFRAMTREEGYYRRLDPTTAVVMQRQVGVMDLVGG